MMSHRSVDPIVNIIFQSQSTYRFRAIPTAYKNMLSRLLLLPKFWMELLKNFAATCSLTSWIIRVIPILPDKLNNTYESDFSVPTLYLMLEIKLYTYNLCHLSRVIILFMIKQTLHIFLLFFMLCRRLISSFRQNHIIINV